MGEDSITLTPAIALILSILCLVSTKRSDLFDSSYPADSDRCAHVGTESLVGTDIEVAFPFEYAVLWLAKSTKPSLPLTSTVLATILPGILRASFCCNHKSQIRSSKGKRMPRDCPSPVAMSKPCSGRFENGNSYGINRLNRKHSKRVCFLNNITVIIYYSKE